MKGPKFIQYFNPVLKALNELGGSGRPAEIVDYIASTEKIEKKEQETLGSGVPRFEKNINWARFYLAKAGYIDGSTRGVWSLTEKGRNIQLSNNEILEIFQHIHNEVKSASTKGTPRPIQEEEILDQGLLQEKLADAIDHRATLLQVLLDLPANGFERLCQRLLRESGFEQVAVTGRTGDGGIDGHGILKITPFVSFKVSFQCKRYSGTVGSPTVRDFRGSIQGRADKGIIITTGSFSSDARKEAIRDGAIPIELVDGTSLLDMMEQLELGLLKKRTITIYEIDSSFFNEFRQN